MKLRHLSIVAGLALCGAAVMAQSTGVPAPAPGASAPKDYNAREQRQDQRIEKGVERGELTKQEAHRLRKEQKAIDRAQAKAEADGQVTDKERARINRMQEKAGKDINRQRHDKKRAPAGGTAP